MPQNDLSQWRVASLKENRLIIFLLGVLVIIALGIVLHQLQTIFQPLLIAIFLSFIFELLVNLFIKIKVPKFLAFLFSIIIIFIVFYLLGLIIYSSVDSFIKEFPEYQTKFNEFYKRQLLKFEIPVEQIQIYISQIKWSEVWNNLSVSSFISSTVGSFITFLSNLFLILLFTIYIVLGKQHMLNKIDKAFPKERAGKINSVISNINRGMQRYLVAKVLISLGTGIVATIILLIFGVKFALVWGLLTFLLNFIPNVGSVIATIPPILVSSFQHDSIFTTLLMALLLISTQITFGNFIEPRVMGKSLNLSPLVVIFSLIFWAFIWGPVGMVVAVPISSAIQIICANIDSLKPISIFMGGD